jgi:hypothetical protein
MKITRDIKLVKFILIILSLQMLNYSFVLPYAVTYLSFKTNNEFSNDKIVAKALEDLFHLGNSSQSGQEETPLDSDDLGVESKVETIAIQDFNKEYFILNNLNKQFILYNKLAISIYHPEFITPPPKLA